jgi:HD-GYP domain-containing protein (c-di-GMP phosphodiesterase class II)
MTKRIEIEKLQVGMYVTDLGSGWLGQAFITPFMLDNEQDIKRLKLLGLQSVLVDLARSNLALSPENERQTDPAQFPEELQPLWRDLPYARACYQSFLRAVADIACDVQLRRKVNLAPLIKVLEQSSQSVRQAKNAWIYLAVRCKAENAVVTHAVVSGIYMLLLARQMRLSRSISIDLAVGAVMQDMGKYRIADHILFTAKPIGNPEFGQIKRHVEQSLRIIGASGQCTETMRLVISQHHERLDGSGYPLGLKEVEISKYGRMAAIVDHYTALVTNSAFRQKKTPDVAMKSMLASAHNYFDQKLLLFFVKAIGVYPIGTCVQLENGKRACVIAQTDHTHSPVALAKQQSSLVTHSARVKRVLNMESDMLERWMANS